MSNNNVEEKNMENRGKYLEILKKESRKADEEQSANIVFKAIRLSLGLTQHEFANLLNSQAKIISRWENKQNILPELNHHQFVALRYELKKLDVDFLNIACYRVVSTNRDLKNYDQPMDLAIA